MPTYPNITKKPDNNYYESDKPSKPISFLNDEGINTTLPKTYRPSHRKNPNKMIYQHNLKVGIPSQNKP